MTTRVDRNKMANKQIEIAKYQKMHNPSNGTARPTLLRYLVNSELPESELSVERLSKEAQVLLGAGTVSTARTLDFICYYILANRKIRLRLGVELKEIMMSYPENMPSFQQLEKLPYLTALIKEGLRYVSSLFH
jgi:cytochrome P450